MYIRTASEGDLEAVRALLVETWHATYDTIYGRDRVTEITDDWHATPTLKGRLKRPESEFILADDGEEIVGMAFAAAVDGGKTVMLHQLYVKPSHHGRGIGMMLVDEIEGCFPGASKVRLEVEEANSRAVGFYLRCGFTKIGTTANCGGEQSGIPAAIFEKPIAWAD
nr:GNAT family N-acetyltransferase [Chelativorans sp. YIM 93263]